MFFYQSLLVDDLIRPFLSQSEKTFQDTFVRTVLKTVSMALINGYGKSTVQIIGTVFTLWS